MRPIEPTAFQRGFGTLSEAERDEIRRIEAAPVQHFGPRRVVIRQNAQFGSAHIVAKGWLAEQKLLHDGRRQILNFRLPGEIVGLEGLAYSKAVFSIVTLTDVELVPVSREAFEHLQRRSPRLASIIFIRAFQTQVILREWELNLGRRDAFARLVHLLLELHRRLRDLGMAKQCRYGLPLTQEELADCLGLTPVYVNRMLKRAREEGLAHFEDRTIVFDDLDRMRQIAGFNAYYLQPDRDPERTTAPPPQ